MIKSYLIRKYIGIASCALTFGLAGSLANAADHVDLPRSAAGAEQQRPDASITDFFAFVNGKKLVMIMNVNPFLDPAVTSYRFPTDVKYRMNVDINSPVTIGTDVGTAEFGGNITKPSLIAEDLVFEVRFDSTNKPILNVTGSDTARATAAKPKVRLFTGLRAEAFIFSPFVRNNVGSIVIEVPLKEVVGAQKQLLVWGTTTVQIPSGTFTELGGRALRSQFPPFVGLNALHPSQHVGAGFGRADVMILDVGKPTAFPNGRNLSDDVVDEAALFTSLPTDRAAKDLEVTVCAPGGDFFPCPVPVSATADDVRILGRFPYMGRPYTPAERTALSSAID